MKKIVFWKESSGHGTAQLNTLVPKQFKKEENEKIIHKQETKVKKSNFRGTSKFMNR